MQELFLHFRLKTYALFFLLYQFNLTQSFILLPHNFVFLQKLNTRG